MAEWKGSAPAIEQTADRLALPAELEAAVSAFLLGATQWRWTTLWTLVGMPTGPVSVPKSLPLGLDYGNLRHACELADLRLTPWDFEGLQIMEAAALKLMTR